MNTRDMVIDEANKGRMYLLDLRRHWPLLSMEELLAKAEQMANPVLTELEVAVAQRDQARDLVECILSHLGDVGFDTSRVLYTTHDSDIEWLEDQTDDGWEYGTYQGQH